MKESHARRKSGSRSPKRFSGDGSAPPRFRFGFLCCPFRGVCLAAAGEARRTCLCQAHAPAVNPSRIKTGWIREQNMILLVYHVTPRQGFSPYLQNNPSYFCFFRLGYGSTVCAVCQRSGNRCIKLHTKRKESKSDIPVSTLFCFQATCTQRFPFGPLTPRSQPK